MKKIIIATAKIWSLEILNALRESLAHEYEISVLSSQEEMTFERLCNENPEYVFFPHWSWIIPREIYTRFSCIVFHMTDLPFGRGGSPLQNLVARGITETQISALSVDSGIDTGKVYFKCPLSLYGGAEEIYIRTFEIICRNMIPYILHHNPTPQPQTGEVVAFKRRTPAMSELTPDMTIAQLFDQIRMLDADGYPKAFLNFGSYTLRFSRPKRMSDGVLADVFIGIERSDENS